MQCSYESSLKWASISSISSFKESRRPKDKLTNTRATHSTADITTATATAELSWATSQSGQLSSPTSACRCDNDRSSRIFSPDPPLHSDASVAESSSRTDPKDAAFHEDAHHALTPSLSDETSPAVSFSSPPVSGLLELASGTTGSPDFGCTRNRHILGAGEDPRGDAHPCYEISSNNDAHHPLTVDRHNDRPHSISDNSSISQDGSSLSGFSSWVIDDTLNGLLLQTFEAPGEEVSFAYCECNAGPLFMSLSHLRSGIVLKHVCRVIPAHDGARNPWRKLAIIALSHPVLLHGVLAVSTAYMFNNGRCQESVLSLRQARALASLQDALNALHDETEDDAHSVSKLERNLYPNRTFSVLSPKEIALAAVLMQTCTVLMSGIGDFEIHVKCALHFIRNLGFLYAPPSSAFSWLLVYRFATVDVLLALSRFRSPMAPMEFFMYHSHADLDHTAPSFREMMGFDHPVLCFLARISVLSADLVGPDASQTEIQTKAHMLETEMRNWGHHYYDAMIRSSSSASTPLGSAILSSEPVDEASALDIVCECHYWVAHVLLMRRVFLDPTRSTRVQLVVKYIFQLMDRLTPGCGPDSTAPFPFYMAAREAVTTEARDWVRQKHAAMMAIYRHRAREYMMEAVENTWKASEVSSGPVPEGTPLWEVPSEKLLREADRAATYFMF